MIRLRPGAVCVLLGALGGLIASCGRQSAQLPTGEASPAGAAPRIYPDYADIVIPPNIAPLNFAVHEPGDRYEVRLSGAQGKPIHLARRSNTIRFPRRRWRELLEANRGRALSLEIRVRTIGGEWREYGTITNRVAAEPIDPYLVYRQIPPVYSLWHDIQIYERHLETFARRDVLDNALLGDGCVNCHAFRANHTDRMTIGVRSAKHGSSTFMSIDKRPMKVGTKFGYTAWHPSGQVVAYSANLVRQFFHWSGTEVRDVLDLDSELAYFDLRNSRAKTDPAIADPARLESYPAWSPDGRYLYFCSAEVPWTEPEAEPLAQYMACLYDLRRIAYDLESDTWGEPETVLSAEETGKSVLLPRVSPDGRFVLLCLCDYGVFPIYQPSSDLCLLDLRTGEWRRLDEANSDRSESWHSWSSNGRWAAFSSKRRDGLFTRTYFTYIDEDGRAHKAFVLPQQDPASDDSYLWTYSVPELTAEPVPVVGRDISDTVTSLDEIPVQSPVKLATAGPAPVSELPWSQGR